ncbi:hypothetical protein P3T16_005659 [Paraburkholderia sp. GAS42]
MQKSPDNAELVVLLQPDDCPPAAVIYFALATLSRTSS